MVQKTDHLCIREGQGHDESDLRTPTESRTITVVGDVYRFLITGEDTNGMYATWEAVVQPGGGPPPHVHSREEEGFYVLEGEITFTVNGERIVAGPGTFANMPVGTPHSFKNESTRPARVLISVACWFGEDVLRGRGAGRAGCGHRSAADEGRDREAVGGIAEVRNRDQAAGTGNWERRRRTHRSPPTSTGTASHGPVLWRGAAGQLSLTRQIFAYTSRSRREAEE